VAIVLLASFWIQVLAFTLWRWRHVVIYFHSKQLRDLLLYKSLVTFFLCFASPLWLNFSSASQLRWALLSDKEKGTYPYGSSPPHA
jgi:hypothetical protein